MSCSATTSRRSRAGAVGPPVATGSKYSRKFVDAEFRSLSSRLSSATGSKQSSRLPSGKALSGVLIGRAAEGAETCSGSDPSGRFRRKGVQLKVMEPLKRGLFHQEDERQKFLSNV